MRKRILSIWLSVCMVLTLLPISAMAEEAGTPIGVSEEIIAFAPLDETEMSVPIGTSVEDLELPESLTATVRAAVVANSGTIEEAVQDSGNPDNLTEATPGSATPTDSGEQEKADEVTEPEWNVTASDIPVTWTSEPEYNGNENGDYVFTPVIEGYKVSAELPEITVTVGAQPRMMLMRGAVPTDLWVGTTKVTDENASNVLGDSGTPTVTYDEESNTLTLNGANITGATQSLSGGGSRTCGIFKESGDLNIVLHGNNTIGFSANSDFSIAGIYTEGQLSIKGTSTSTDSLSVTNTFATPGESFGIRGTTGVTIEGCTVNATAGSITDDQNTSGIYVNTGSLSIKNAVVTGTGGSTQGESFGICTDQGLLSIENSTVTANGGDGTRGSYGLVAVLTATISNSTVTATGNTCAFFFIQPLTITGHTATASTNRSGDGATAVTLDTNVYGTSNTYKYVKIAPPQAQWGVAGSDGAAPTTWIGSGTLGDAMTYANANSGAYIKLQGDVDTTAVLDFAAGKTTVLDLNGFDVNRGLTSAIQNGMVLKVSGDLTLCDSSTTTVANQGTITGGNSSFNGGGVSVQEYGRFTMNGGNIANNSVSDSSAGGGVSVANNAVFTMKDGSIHNNTAIWGGGVGVPYANSPSGGSFTMTGGSITDNTATGSAYSSSGGVMLGGGMYTYSAIMSIGGTAKITGNKVVISGSETPSNLHITTQRIRISTPLTNGAQIGVSTNTAPTGDTPVAITDDNNADYSAYFHSDNSSYLIQNGTGNTVQLAVPVPVIGTLSISGSFTAGHNLALSELTAPTVTTKDGILITEKGWQSCVDSGSWTNWPEGGVLPLDTSATYKLRYYATYSGGTVYSNEVTLNVVGNTTALALTASPESQQIVGSSITLTATLTGYFTGPGVNGQAITFKNGGTDLGTANLNTGGVAVFTWTPDSTGTCSLTAEYAATPYNTAAASNTVSYTVTVDPDIAIVAAAKTTLVDGTVNVAFGADQTAKTAAVQAYVNSLLTGEAAGVTATLTYNSGTGKYDVALSKGSVNDSKSLSMTVNVAPDPDIAIVAAAKTAAQGTSYADMTQTAATDEDAIKAALKNTAETAVNNSDITVTINKVSYIAPIAGTPANPSGTNGSYTFTVTVSKGNQSDTTVQKTIVITATPYTGVTDAQAVSAAKTALVDGTVNVAFGADQTAKTAAVQAYVNGLLSGNAAGVTATVTYNSGTGKYDVALSKGSVNDSKSLSMTVNVAPDPDIAIVAAAKTAAESASYANMTQATAPNENTIKTALKSTAETAVSNGSVAVTINQISYTPPIAGTSTNPGGTNGSYTFTITVSKGSQSETTVQKTITITATPYTGGTGGGGGNGGGSGSGSNTPAPSTKPTEPVTGNTENKATVDGKGNANVSLTDKNITDAIADAKAEATKKGVNAGDITAVIHVTTGGRDANTVTVNLPKTTQEQVIDNKIASVQLVIDRPDLTIGIDLAAVMEINRQAKADVQLSATRIDNAKLSGDAKSAIGNRPAYDLKALYGSGKSVTDFGKGSVSVEIPYTLKKGEIAGNVYAVYVDAKGKVIYLTDSSYDARRGTVVFSTSHFSTYGIAYKASFNFTDIDGHWAKDDILFVANRGLMTGTSSTTFSPNGSMTRGMFVTALGRLADADVSGYTKSSFTDVKANAYYMGYIEWGVKNNILVGIDGDKFDPDGLVTREQMAVIMDRYATAIGFKLPEVHAQNTFADNAKIGAWAASSVKRIQMAGIIQGKRNNLYDPQGTATRAEVSAVLRRFVELAIFNDTAQGWSMNDSGQWMYYENGKPIIGKKDIGGTTYTFDQYGVTADVPKDRTYSTYTVQRGDSFWTIARKFNCTMAELERLNNKGRFSLIHPGDVLRVPEQK
ncbi:LysM peptidoglycan-binding domain-containing protein [Lacrimispora amygdalina]|uniref:LysM peptidoglycan-binding domain-containing protein n=1 Tax=Lacrimispora amygdalina TaxID=253257 RepID=A0A3E2N8Q7_9FIRM|nr:S-layer homology domain-containing protein [Clostridium indicum]RFZ77388.1 LysM peptidoglycan-binding domain-containing protein [Clostridium indicum]